MSRVRGQAARYVSAVTNIVPATLTTACVDLLNVTTETGKLTNVSLLTPVAGGSFCENTSLSLQVTVDAGTPFTLVPLTNGDTLTSIMLPYVTQTSQPGLGIPAAANLPVEVGYTTSLRLQICPVADCTGTTGGPSFTAIRAVQQP